MSAQVKVQWKALSAALKNALKTKKKKKVMTSQCKVNDKTEIAVTSKGFSPVWTSRCRLSLLGSTKDLPHSAQTCIREPCLRRCFCMTLMLRNIFRQPSWTQETGRSSSSPVPPAVVSCKCWKDSAAFCKELEWLCGKAQTNKRTNKRLSYDKKTKWRKGCSYFSAALPIPCIPSCPSIPKKAS